MYGRGLGTLGKKRARPVFFFSRNLRKKTEKKLLIYQNSDLISELK